MCLSAFFLTFNELLHHYSMSPLRADSNYKIVFHVNYLLPLVVYIVYTRRVIKHIYLSTYLSIYLYERE